MMNTMSPVNMMNPSMALPTPTSPIPHTGSATAQNRINSASFPITFSGGWDSNSKNMEKQTPTPPKPGFFQTLRDAWPVAMHLFFSPKRANGNEEKQRIVDQKEDVMLNALNKHLTKIDPNITPVESVKNIKD